MSGCPASSSGMSALGLIYDLLVEGRGEAGLASGDDKDDVHNNNDNNKELKKETKDRGKKDGKQNENRKMTPPFRLLRTNVIHQQPLVFTAHLLILETRPPIIFYDP